MKISEKKVVELAYKLEVEGQLVDEADKNAPLDYIHGTRMLLPGFETRIEGLEPGDEFSFSISAEEGYGEYDESQLMELPKSAFEVSGKMAEDLLKEGNILPLVNGEGMVVRGIVKELHDDYVTMDFNHPMAGKTLNFTGSVLSVREATEKELTEGLHGEFLPMEGGCCCHGGGHHHEDEGCCHGGGHHHEDEGCCHGGGHHHEDGGCCHGDGHHHEDEGCCHGGGHHHEDGGCCHGDGHHHEDEGCCHGGGHHHGGCCHN